MSERSQSVEKRLSTLYVLVRNASLEDSDSVTSLLRASYPTLMRGAYEDSLLNAVLPVMTVAQPVLLRSGTYYVAETVEGSLIGCGGWTKERPGSGEVVSGVAHIRHFGVHHERTRQGVGRSLYVRCRDDARRAGVTQFECYSSLNGESFYAALGFERDRIIDVEIADGIAFPSVRMLATI